MPSAAPRQCTRSCPASVPQRPPAGQRTFGENRQSSLPSSATSTGSGSAPTLNSSSLQRPPPTRRDSSDQQQFPIPPVTRSSSPSSLDMPQVNDAPCPTTTTSDPGSDSSAILVSAAAVR